MPGNNGSTRIEALKAFSILFLSVVIASASIIVTIKIIISSPKLVRNKQRLRWKSLELKKFQI